MAVQYSQPITRLYEVGSQKFYYVAGRPQGSANLARVLGPGNVMSAIYECLGNVCLADENDICFCFSANCSLSGAQEATNAIQFAITNVVLQSIGFSVAAQDMMINEQMSLFFASMLAQDLVDGCDIPAPVEVNPLCFITEA